jgi:hypothetical protein
MLLTVRCSLCEVKTWYYVYRNIETDFLTVSYVYKGCIGWTDSVHILKSETASVPRCSEERREPGLMSPLERDSAQFLDRILVWFFFLQGLRLAISKGPITLRSFYPFPLKGKADQASEKCGYFSLRVRGVFKISITTVKNIPIHKKLITTNARSFLKT